MTGYWIVLGNSLNDPDAAKEYSVRWEPIAAKYKATFKAGPNGHEVKEGIAFERAFIVEFPDFETALACYNSPEYQSLTPLIERAYTRQLVIVPGH